MIRGGYGKFFAEGTADEMHQTLLFVLSVAPQVLYDGRPDFPSNPYNGPQPLLSDLLAQACDLNGSQPGCIRREFIPEMVDPFFKTPHSHQASIGIQRQFGTSVAVESNYVYTGGRGEEGSKNVNLNYNPATGANYAYDDVAHLPMPEFGRIQLTAFEGWSNYHAWESSLTKRMSGRWQAQITYTLAQFKDAGALPFAHAIVDGRLTRAPLGFAVQPDLGGDYTLAATDQRHRAVFNGIWEGPYGIQFSGLYLRLRRASRDQLRRRPAKRGSRSEERLRPNGTISPRNSLVGDSLHRIDVRLQKRIALGSKASFDGILELFNLFNHENYGSYVTDESNANFGQPTFNNNIAYQPRSMQLGFRFAF